MALIQISQSRPVDQGRNLTMNAGSFYIPKSNKTKPLGEDAHFVCNEDNTIGVADGVGGWARHGIDAGIFARELMLFAEYELQNQVIGDIDPLLVLKLALLNTEAQGSSTACIVTLSGNYLHAANIGDSGFMVIRNGTTVYHSPVQQHEFNHPYQLGKYGGDDVNLAQKLTVEVKPGDIVILGTDGLFDNVFESEIEDIVKTCVEKNNSPKVMAWNIATAALKRSTEQYSFTPFTKACMEAKRKLRLGGKYDDITVIVSFIQAM